MSNTVSFNSLSELFQCYLAAGFAVKDNGVVRVHPVGTFLSWPGHLALVLDAAWIVDGQHHSLCYDDAPTERCHSQDFFEELPE